ncbi:MAG: DUF433 domain-containing protein [Pseudanabaena sp. CAN_BIN31]|nr:DUF433 domain-containing protein [Pseudanabaena sp. CAN_BIN31]
MVLEDYLEFLDRDDIRIKGHRIGVDDVIKYYLGGYSPEQILSELSTLNLEKVYAVITYYLHNRMEMDAYMLRLQKWREQHYQELSVKAKSPVVERLKEIKKQRERMLLNFS